MLGTHENPQIRNQSSSSHLSTTEHEEAACSYKAASYRNQLPENKRQASYVDCFKTTQKSPCILSKLFDDQLWPHHFMCSLLFYVFRIVLIYIVLIYMYIVLILIYTSSQFMNWIVLIMCASKCLGRLFLS